MCCETNDLRNGCMRCVRQHALPWALACRPERGSKGAPVVTCPACSSSDTRVTRTIPGATVSRQHQCKTCGAGWWSDERVRPKSVAISSLPVACRQDTVSSDSDLPVRNSDLKSVTSQQSDAPARSKQGAEFVRLLQVFCDRWQRSNKRPYPVVPADRNQLGRFMQMNGHYIEGFAAICDRYLSDRSTFTIQKSGNHRLAWLLTNGLAQFGGTPRETAEQYSARLRREHEVRKAESRRPVRDPRLLDLVTDLADKKAIGNG